MTEEQMANQAKAIEAALTRVSAAIPAKKATDLADDLNVIEKFCTNAIAVAGLLAVIWREVKAVQKWDGATRQAVGDMLTYYSTPLTPEPPDAQ